MIVFRRRLIYWLLKEYVRKWGKTIIFFFLAGLLVFFFFRDTASNFIAKIPLQKDQSIGLLGSYTIDSLPNFILSDLSFGLTTVDNSGKVSPKIAKSWRIEDDGKRYVFNLRADVHFNDGTVLTSDLVNYNFSDASVRRLSKYTISYQLKDKYSPFLVTVSRPLFKKGLVGMGLYKIKNVDLNGNFVESITLVDKQNQSKKKTYHFYPDTQSLKTAYVLGEVSAIIGAFDTSYETSSFEKFPNTLVTKTTNYNSLVALFFNTKDSVLSDRNIRSGLSFALPNEYKSGVRAGLPYPPSSFVYANQYLYTQDLDQAKLLTRDLINASNSAALSIKVLPHYIQTAQVVKESWEKIGVKSKIETVERIPSSFQVFLGDFFVPKDPDQYRLWHSSSQETNITNYANQRIDKLLEDGRKTTDVPTRIKLYQDFQKYLLADSPAAFLYFPYEYEIKRK